MKSGTTTIGLSGTIFLTAVAWLPLLGCALMSETFISDSGYIGFWKDYSVHARLLFALPLLLFIEPMFRYNMELFIRAAQTIVPAEDKVKFQKFSSWLQAAVGSRKVIVVIALITVLSVIVFRIGGEFSSTSWVHNADGSITLGGWWYYLVSNTIFLTILLRWLFRWGCWAYIILRLSRIPLRVDAAHADGLAGLHFATFMPFTFTLVSCAVAGVMSGVISLAIIHGGMALSDFYIDIAVFCLISTALVYLPLVLFLPRVSASYYDGVIKFGALIRNHHQDFRSKWFAETHHRTFWGQPIHHPRLTSTAVMLHSCLFRSFRCENRNWCEPQSSC